MSHRDPLTTRLGRKVLYRTLLAGLLPLLFFSAPYTWFASRHLSAEADRTLSNYARLAGNGIFETLAQARMVLESKEMERLDTGVVPFRRLYSLTNPNRGPWGAIDSGSARTLEAGRTILSSPYPAGEVACLALIHPRPDGTFRVGELDPEVLWSATEGSSFGARDRVYILDGSGRVLASSHPHSLFAPLLAEPVATPVPRGEAVIDGERFRWAASDLWLSGAFGQGRLVVVLARPHADIVDLPRRMALTLFFLAGISLAALVLLSTRFSRQLVLPIQELAEATHHIGRSLPAPLASGKQEDELGELARAFRRMSESLESNYRSRLRLAQDASIGRVAGRLAHKINNPLTALRICFARLDRKGVLADRKEDLDLIRTSLDRIHGTVMDLLRYAREAHGKGGPNASDLGAVAAAALRLFSPAFEEGGIRLEIEIPPDLPPVRGRADEIEEVLSNLLENAREALPPGGRIFLRATRGEDEVHLRVEDDGPGLGPDPEVHFEPFRTTKVWGTGLGLSICRQIMDGLGGKISAETRPEGGARFLVRLPYAK